MSGEVTKGGEHKTLKARAMCKDCGRVVPASLIVINEDSVCAKVECPKCATVVHTDEPALIS